MAKSRFVAGTILLVYAFQGAAAAPLAGAATGKVTAEQAIARYRERFVPVEQLACPKEGPDDIVVCGRVGYDPNHLVFPQDPDDRVRLVAGEAPSGLRTMDAGSVRCSTVGNNQNCGGGISPFVVIGVVAKLLNRLSENKDR
jgi:hypothetical protein